MIIVASHVTIPSQSKNADPIHVKSADHHDLKKMYFKIYIICLIQSLMTIIHFIISHLRKFIRLRQMKCTVHPLKSQKRKIKVVMACHGVQVPNMQKMLVLLYNVMSVIDKGLYILNSSYQMKKKEG